MQHVAPKQSLPYFLYDNIQRRFIEIRDGTVFGRLNGEVRFPEDDVLSRTQCQFRIAGNDVYIEDLNSTNGTQVNSVVIRPLIKRRIQLNDVIQFGMQRFTLTNQTDFPPPGVEDRREGPRVYKGIRNDDGSVSCQVAQVTKRTRVLLDRQSFHKARLREFIGVAAPPLFTLPRVVGEGVTRNVRRPRRGFSMLAGFVCGAVVASIAIYYLRDQPQAQELGRRVASVLGY